MSRITPPFFTLELPQRSGPVDKNIRRLKRSLDGLVRPENSSQLLEGALLRLDEEEVHDDNFKRVPEYEQEIILPSGSAKRNICNEGVVELRDINQKLFCRQRLNVSS